MFGDAKLSAKHSNFLINEANASSKDMKNLINFIKENVYKKTGVNLELEIILLLKINEKKVLILAGGYSKERAISIKTARAVYKQIRNEYISKILDPNKDFLKKLKKFKPNIIFNALHGRYGEDGYIQLILENEKIKYTHSGVRASAICINKLISKEIF